MGNIARRTLVLLIVLSLIIPFAAAVPHGTHITITPYKASIEHPVVYQTTSNESKIVIFDESKGTYRDHTKLSYFIDYLNNTLNRTVIINTGPITTALLAAADILIIPNPGAPYTSDEVDAIHRFVENGGALLVMGDGARYFNPDYLNPIVAAYNVTFLDVTVNDDTDNSYRSYNPIAHVFNTQDEVVLELVNNVTDVYMYGSTSLNVSAPSVIVATGDNDTYVTDEEGNVLDHPAGYEIVYMAYYIYPNEYQGRVFIVGATGRLRDSYGYYDHNAPFVANLMARLASAHKNKMPAIALTSKISSDIIAYLDTANLTITVESIGGVPVENVTLTVTLPAGLSLVQGNTTYRLGDMNPGESYTFELVLNATYTLKGEITVMVVADNLADAVIQQIDFEVIPALDIVAAAKPTAVNINTRTDFTLEVNVTNVSLHNVDNIDVTLSLPEGIVGENTHATIDLLSPGERATVSFDLHVDAAGIYTINVQVYAKKGLPYPAIIKVSFIATETPNLIVVDVSHTNRPGLSDIQGFINLLKTYGTVIINNGTITPDLLEATKLFVLAYPKYGLTQSEINALIDYARNGGSLIVAGNAARYASVDGQAAINAIGSAFGVYFMNVTVNDDTNNSYRPYTPIIHNFNTQDPVGKVLFKDVDLIYYQAGTALSISSDEVVPLAFGDNDTYLTDAAGNVLNNVTGTDIIVMAYRSEGGKVLFIGSTGRFRDKYDYFSTNTPFINNLITRMLSAPQITITAEVSSTNVKVEDTIELTLTIKNTGLDAVKLQIAIAADDGLQILNASTIENATINVDYLTEVTVNPNETVTLKILIKAVSAGDRNLNIYYTIEGGKPVLLKTFTINVSETGEEEEGGLSTAAIVGIIAVIIAIIAVVVYMFFIKKKE